MGEYVGHLEPTIEDTDEEKNLHLQAKSDAHTTSSAIRKNIVSEQVEPNASRPNLKCFWRSIHHNSLNMKPQLAQHL